MILQISKNEKYTSLNDKYTICAEWGSIREIQTTLPSINVQELVNAMSTKNKYNNYYWVELKW